MTGNTYVSTGKHHTVLLIGHDLGVLKRVAFSLQRKGHSIIWANDGAAGLRTAKAERPDLIICETVLNDLSGFDLCQELKSSLLSHTPLVLMGALGDEPSDIPRAFRAGADDYFARILDWKRVIEKLHALVPMRSTTPSHLLATNRMLELAEICFE